MAALPIVDLLINQVKDKGWLSIGNIMFEDGVPCVNPFTAGGMVCLSESKEMLFTTGIHDTHNTFVLENGFLAQDDHMAGVQQTIVCCPFARLRQFDIHMYSQWFRTDGDGHTGDKFLVPNYPKESEVNSYTFDEETGLCEGADIVTSIGSVEESTLPVYSDYPKIQVEYVGYRIKEFQAFLKTQKMFCELVGSMFGASDVI